MMAARVSLYARVPEELYEQLRLLAFERHTSLNQLVIDAIRAWLERQAEGRE